MPAFPELESERLRLRQFREGDLDAWTEITADAATMRFIGSGRAFTREDARSSLGYARAHWEIRGFGLWAAEEKASGDLIGRIGHYQPEGWPGLEVGWLVRRERQGEGFATEGARVALDHAFVTLGVDRVISVIQPENRASIRVAEKLGEAPAETRQLEGRLVVVYSIERACWARERLAHPEWAKPRSDPAAPVTPKEKCS